ncbi:MAG: two-component system phosphate regulon response regulator PhoB [Gammaproteobacteria bacterium]|jgi:two-component system phosphate regulon response regulator PhoB
MQGQKILIVEDDQAIREMVLFALEKEGFDVVEAGDATSARIAVADSQPDLVLMDWMLPGISGVEIARGLKRDDDTKHIPIIMLTARGEEDDRVQGLDSGADDYIVKPFSVRELNARIRAVLRRNAGESNETIDAGGITLDVTGARVTAGGKAVHLGPTEFRLLQFFMSHPDRVYNRTQLLDRVWGANVYVEERTVDVHIRRLRKALEPYGVESTIQTVRGMGYRFSEQD